MAESFSVGDVCVIVDNPLHLPEHRQYIGCECTIIRMGGSLWFDCEIDLPAAGNRVVRAKFQVLRKVPPKQDWAKLCSLTDLPREVAHV